MPSLCMAYCSCIGCNRHHPNACWRHMALRLATCLLIISLCSFICSCVRDSEQSRQHEAGFQALDTASPPFGKAQLTSLHAGRPQAEGALQGRHVLATGPLTLISGAAKRAAQMTQELTDRFLSDSSRCCGLLSDADFSSNLPVVVIETFGQQIPDDPRITAQMCTCGSGSDYDGPISIEIRGSSSARLAAKKSFHLSTRDSSGAKVDTPFMGFPADSQWVLYGPENDLTMGMRNVLAMDTSRQMGQYASRTRHCEVFLVQDNKTLDMSHYWGLYVAMEKITVSPNRVNISPMRSQDLSDLSGGYIVRYEHAKHKPDETVFYTNVDFRTLEWILQYPTWPEDFDSQNKAMTWIADYLSRVERAMLHGSRGDWEQLLDESAFTDYLLGSEVTKNPDAYRGSVYMFKDKGQALHMGPLWDYNEAFGLCCGYPIEGYQNGGSSSGSSGGSAISPQGWRFNICDESQRCISDPIDGVSLWYRQAWKDPGFRSSVAGRWRQLRSGALSNGYYSSKILQMRSLISAAADRNSRRWSNVLSQQGGGDFNSAVDFLQDWLTTRLNWMDSALNAFH